MGVDAQRDVEISRSGDALDDMRWCFDLKQQADHRVAEVMKPYIGISGTGADAVKVPVQPRGSIGVPDAGWKNKIMFGSRFIGVGAFGGLAVVVFDQGPVV